MLYFIVGFCWGFMLVLYFCFCAEITTLCRHHFVNKIFFYFDNVYSLRGELWGEMWVHNWNNTVTWYYIVWYLFTLYRIIPYSTVHTNQLNYYYILLVRSLTSYHTYSPFTGNFVGGLSWVVEVRRVGERYSIGKARMAA